MSLIYSNAELTIAADASPGCTAGFWSTNNNRFEKINKHCWVREIADTAQDILSTRGWTLQARILSHRILHISNIGISWECDVCCEIEDGQPEVDFTRLSYHAFRFLNRSKPVNYGAIGSNNIYDFLTSGTWRSIFFAWTSIVEDYSRRRLTEPNDKLPAISGLARTVLSRTGLSPESYLVGLWKEELIDGLLWYVPGQEASPSKETYIAPTWSWASVVRGICYFRDRYQFKFTSHIKVHDAYCTTVSSDTTGRVTEGAIHLDGLMVEIDLAAVPNAYPPNCQRWKQQRGDVVRGDVR
jgi:hypothetical protein